MKTTALAFAALMAAAPVAMAENDDAYNQRSGPPPCPYSTCQGFYVGADNQWHAIQEGPVDSKGRQVDPYFQERQVYRDDRSYYRGYGDGRYNDGRYNDGRYAIDSECWNPRARHFERVRPGERQDDLDFSRCRSLRGWR